MTNRPLSETNLDRLERLAKLRAAGALNDAEFEEQKKAILFTETPGQQASGSTDRVSPSSSRRSSVRNLLWVAGGVAALCGLLLLWSNRPGASPAPTANQSSAAPAVSAKSADRSVLQAAQPSASRPSPSVRSNGQAVFPREFRGIWGTSADSCAGRDDYGPMVVTANGFTFYEAYGTLAQAPRQVGARTIEVRFLPDEEEQHPPLERWTLNTDGSLTRMDTRFRRCPPRTRSPL